MKIIHNLLLTTAILSVIISSRLYSEMPEDFVFMRDINNSIIYDIRYYTPYNFVGDTIDGYLCAECILTRRAAEAVDKIQKELLEFGLTLKIFDCYRPQMAVDHFVRWAEDVNDNKMKKAFYPDVDKNNLFKDGYIAAKSSHSRGSTVDLTIVPIPVPEQQEIYEGMELAECYLPKDIRFGDNMIDMGTDFDCFSDYSHPKNPDITESQRINRLLLRTLMLKHGFVPYEYEWWHFTFEDEPYPDTYFNFPVQR